MAAVQLKFNLRTSSNVKTVHLVGSWDHYSRQIPLSRESSKPGAWVGKFRFQTSMLKLGGRYWYYVSCWFTKCESGHGAKEIVHHGWIPGFP